MKKLFLAVLLLASSKGIVGQTSSLGIKAGFNFSTLGGDVSNDFDGRTGFHVGIQVEVPIAGKLAIQPEILYSSMGANANIDGFDEVEQRLNYLQIPIMAKLYGGNSFNFQLGPYIGTMVAAVASSQSQIDQSVQDLYEDFDYGLNLGFGVRLNNGLNFTARYSIGFANINGVPNSNEKVRNRAFQLSVGYFFKN